MTGTAYNTIMNMNEIITWILYMRKRMMKMMDWFEPKMFDCIYVFRKMFWRKEPCVLKPSRNSPSLSSCQDHGGTTRTSSQSSLMVSL